MTTGYTIGGGAHFGVTGKRRRPSGSSGSEEEKAKKPRRAPATSAAAPARSALFDRWPFGPVSQWTDTTQVRPLEWNCTESKGDTLRCSCENIIHQTDGTCWYASLLQLLAHVPEITNHLTNTLEYTVGSGRTRSHTTTKVASLRQYIRDQTAISDSTCARIPLALRNHVERMANRHQPQYWGIDMLEAARAKVRGTPLYKLGQTFNDSCALTTLYLNTLLDYGGIPCWELTEMGDASPISVQIEALSDYHGGSMDNVCITIKLDMDAAKKMDVEHALMYVQQKAAMYGAVGGILDLFDDNESVGHGCAFTMCRGDMRIRNTWKSDSRGFDVVLEFDKVTNCVLLVPALPTYTILTATNAQTHLELMKQELVSAVERQDKDTFVRLFRRATLLPTGQRDPTAVQRLEDTVYPAIGSHVQADPEGDTIVREVSGGRGIPFRVMQALMYRNDAGLLNHYMHPPVRGGQP